MDLKTSNVLFRGHFVWLCYINKGYVTATANWTNTYLPLILCSVEANTRIKWTVFQSMSKTERLHIFIILTYHYLFYDETEAPVTAYDRMCLAEQYRLADSTKASLLNVFVHSALSNGSRLKNCVRWMRADKGSAASHHLSNGHLKHCRLLRS